MKYIIAIILAFCLAHSLVFGAEIDIQKIIQIESSGDPHAFNKKSGAIGLMQITKPTLADWNNEEIMPLIQRVKFNKYDLYCPYLNQQIGTWYINERIPQMLKAYRVEDTVENRLIAYHDGIGNLRKYLAGKRKLGKNMKGYLRKYRESKLYSKCRHRSQRKSKNANLSPRNQNDGGVR